MRRIRHIYILIYGIISLIIILGIGTEKLFLLDIVFTNNGIYTPLITDKFSSLLFGTSNYSLNTLPFILGLDLLGLLLGDIIIYVIIFLIFFISGICIHICMHRRSGYFIYFASFLYMINAFVYIRFITGHWLLLISYAILPFSIKYFIELLEKKEIKSAIKFAFFISLVAFNIHMLIITLIIMSIIFIFWLSKYRDVRSIKMLSIATVIFILLNFYWIFPLVTAKNTLIDNIGEEDYKVFAPKIDNLSDLFNIASMYGFWREGYIYTKDFIPYWQLLSIFIILLAVYGFISFYKDEKIGYMVKVLGVIWIIGFILATGINGPFGEANGWLYDNTILKGFRDSHKFVAMIVFAYAILGGLGVNKIKNTYDDIDKERYNGKRL